MGVDKNVLLVSSVGVVAVLGLVVLMLGQGGGPTAYAVGCQDGRAALTDAYSEKYGGDVALAEQIAACVEPCAGNAGDYGSTGSARSDTRGTRAECEVVVLGAPYNAPVVVGDGGVANREAVRRFAAADAGADGAVNYRIQNDIDNCVNAKTRLGLGESKAIDYCTCKVSTSGRSDDFCFDAANFNEGDVAIVEGTPKEAGKTGIGMGGYSQQGSFLTGNFVDIYKQCMVRPQNEESYPEEGRRAIYCRCKTTTKDGDCKVITDKATVSQVDKFMACMAVFEASPTARITTNLKHAWQDCSTSTGLYSR